MVPFILPGTGTIVSEYFMNVGGANLPVGGAVKASALLPDNSEGCQSCVVFSELKTLAST